MSRLLCFGDIHLGQGSQYPGRLTDQADVLGQIAALAVEQHVDGIMFAGDAFEGPGIPPEQLQVFARFVADCRSNGIPILAITGNGKHDAAVRDTNGLAIFDHIDGIEVSAYPGVHEFCGCIVATLPWVHPGRLIAQAGADVPRDEANRVVGDLLVDVAADLKGDYQPSILLAHWSISGTSLPAGLPVDQLREPVIPVEALEQIGFDHIVAGHIHQPQPIGTTGFYTGSPLPLNFGEEHLLHGAWLLDTDEKPSVFMEVTSPPFVTIDHDFTGGDAGVSMLDMFLPDIPEDALVRARFTATQEQAAGFDIGMLRRELLASGARHVTVEPNIVRQQRARVAGVDEQMDELAALDIYITAYDIADELARQMRDRARDYLGAAA